MSSMGISSNVTTCLPQRYLHHGQLFVGIAIVTFWDWLKDDIEDHWGLDTNPGYDKLRRYVKEAWEALPYNDPI